MELKSGVKCSVVEHPCPVYPTTHGSVTFRHLIHHQHARRGVIIFLGQLRVSERHTGLPGDHLRTLKSGSDYSARRRLGSCHIFMRCVEKCIQIVCCGDLMTRANEDLQLIVHCRHKVMVSARYVFFSFRFRSEVPPQVRVDCPCYV